MVGSRCAARERVVNETAAPVDVDLTLERDVITWALEREIVAPIDNPHVFYRHAHSIIWRVILDLQAQGRSPGYLLVRSRLDEIGQLETVEPIYLYGLSKDSVRPSSQAVASAAEMLQTKAQARFVREICRKHAAEPAIHLDEILEQLTSLGCPDAKSGPALINDVEMLNVQEPDWLIEKIVPARCFTVGYGEPGIGKTAGAVTLSVAVAGRRAFLGHGVRESGPVIYVAYEGQSFLGKRVGAAKLALGYVLEEPVGIHRYRHPLSLLSSSDVARFISEGAASTSVSRSRSMQSVRNRSVLLTWSQVVSSRNV